MVHRTHGNVGTILLFQRHPGIERLAQGTARQVDAATSGGYPTQSAIKPRGIVSVLPAADSHLAQVVHACPNKIADESGLLFGKLPESVGIVTEGLAAQNQPIRVLFQIPLVAVDAVVVARDVHVGKGVPGAPVAGRDGGSPLHKLVPQ